jgi:hypothetical protein
MLGEQLLNGPHVVLGDLFLDAQHLDQGGIVLRGFDESPTKVVFVSERQAAEKTDLVFAVGIQERSIDPVSGGAAHESDGNGCHTRGLVKDVIDQGSRHLSV